MRIVFEIRTRYWPLCCCTPRGIDAVHERARFQSRLAQYSIIILCVTLPSLTSHTCCSLPKYVYGVTSKAVIGKKLSATPQSFPLVSAMMSSAASKPAISALVRGSSCFVFAYGAFHPQYLPRNVQPQTQFSERYAIGTVDASGPWGRTVCATLAFTVTAQYINITQNQASLFLPTT